MKYGLLGLFLLGMGILIVRSLKDFLPDPEVLPGWDTEERRRMMLRAEEEQDEDMRFV